MRLGHFETLPDQAKFGQSCAAAERLGKFHSTLTGHLRWNVGNAGFSLLRPPLKGVGSGSSRTNRFSPAQAVPTCSGNSGPWGASSPNKGVGCLMSLTSCRSIPSFRCKRALHPEQCYDESARPFADTRRPTACRPDRAQGKFGHAQLGLPVMQGIGSGVNPGEHHAALH